MPWGRPAEPWRAQLCAPNYIRSIDWDNRHVVLLGVAAVVLDDLATQIGALSGGDIRVIFDGLVIVQFGRERYSEVNMSWQRAANLDVDRLRRVVANPLCVVAMFIPTGNGAANINFHFAVIHHAIGQRRFAQRGVFVVGQ